ncbi:response regulator [Desulfolithobacter sp.]
MSGERILIVEDDGIIALLLQEITTRYGYEVVAMVATGKEAVEQAISSKPDLILMDIHLADDVDGIEAATRIRASQDIPVVYLTAYADDTTLERAKITEPYAYVLKPVTEKELHIAICLALHKHRSGLQQKKQLAELRKSFQPFQVQQVILPICARCKKIKRDQDGWEDVASFIEKHSETRISHVICPECARILYGDEQWYRDSRDDPTHGDREDI